MRGKEKSLSRSREPRDPFRLVGTASQDGGDFTPPKMWDTQSAERDETPVARRDSTDSDKDRSSQATDALPTRAAVGYVAYTDAPQLRSRPVDIGGSSGVFVHEVDRAVEAASGQPEVPDLLKREDVSWRQLSEKEAEELPESVHLKLDEQDVVQATALFGDLAGRVVTLEDGWNTGYSHGADVLSSLILSADGQGFTRAVYYYLSVFATEAGSDPKALARLKGIQPETIRAQLRKAESDWGEELADLVQQSDAS